MSNPMPDPSPTAQLITSTCPSSIILSIPTEMRYEIYKQVLPPLPSEEFRYTISNVSGGHELFQTFCTHFKLVRILEREWLALLNCTRLDRQIYDEIYEFITPKLTMDCLIQADNWSWHPYIQCFHGFFSKSGPTPTFAAASMFNESGLLSRVRMVSEVRVTIACSERPSRAHGVAELLDGIIPASDHLDSLIKAINQAPSVKTVKVSLSSKSRFQALGSNGLIMHLRPFELLRDNVQLATQIKTAPGDELDPLETITYAEHTFKLDGHRGPRSRHFLQRSTDLSIKWRKATDWIAREMVLMENASPIVGRVNPASLVLGALRAYHVGCERTLDQMIAELERLAAREAQARA